MKEVAKILIADDEPFIRRSLAFILKMNGCEVVSVKHGREAWENLNQGFEPDILFLDVMTPQFSGFKLCRLIKEHPRLRNIYVIWLTARWQKSDKEKAESVGIDEYITKPFSPSSIVRRVREIIEAKHEHNYG